jgi:L-threonylcarbamoyladenylate synthase
VLAQRFWPGPLTVVLKRSERVLDQVTGGQPTVAIRMPAHPVALALLNEFGGGLAAPSANRFGRLSPTEAEDVRREFGSEVALVLDGGRCTVGIESTILDLSDDAPRILRPGMILRAQLEDALDRRVEIIESGAHSSVRVPGGLPGHYAPRTPLKLVPSPNFVGEVESLLNSNTSLAVLSFQPPVSGCSSESWLQSELNAAQYARLLYSNLRKLDHNKAAIILVEEPPDVPDWAGVRDRLRRAQHGVS